MSGVSTGNSNGQYTYSGSSLALTSTTSASDGSFSFNISSGCSPDQLVYVAEAGGNAGGGTNTAILNVAVLGFPTSTTCAGLPAVTTINEVTTVATAYAFSGFIYLGSGNSVNITAPVVNDYFPTTGTNSVTSGAVPPTVTTASGLYHAYLNAINLANMSNGTANTVLPSNPQAVTPAAVVNAIANALQACVITTASSSP